jgi:hypothetical protein
MAIIETIKDFISSKKTEKITLEPSDAQKKIFRYWSSNVKRARKAQRKDDWDKAEERFSAGKKTEDEDSRPYVNDCRKQHEASMAFLDQQDAGFKVTPTEGWMSDPTALKQAECDAAYLKRVWVEQKMQKAESRKLNDALMINNGTTLVQFDIKKWMPVLRYLPQRNVLRDPDAGGLGEEAGWEGYEEDVPVEQFRSWHTDIEDKVFEAIVKKAGSVLKDEERDEADDVDKPMYRTVKVVHIFARNASAIRKEEKQKTSEPEAPPVPLAEELQLSVPRRYMQLVEGWPALIVDEPMWPLDLDDDEFPLTHLQFNQLNNDTYGFTDYEQMSRLDELGDDILRDLGWASFWAAVTKFLGSKTQQVTKEELDNFLNEPRVSALPSMLDEEGNPKLKPVERGRVDGAQMQLYELIHEQTKEASSLSETLSNADAQTFKDVTAIAARIADANMHQRVNRRLGGPWGYEQSISEDAIKVLEVAHQLVPKYSSVAVMEQMPLMDEATGEPMLDEMGQPVLGEEQENVRELPWQEARAALAQGGTLIKLGVDAIVGPQLAEFWPYRESPKQWKLNIKVIVEPGTTRAITRQQQSAVMKQLYVELFQPFYQMIMQYNPVMGMNFMRDFLEFIGRLAQVPDIEQKLPDPSMIMQMVQEFLMQQQAQMQQQAEQEMAGEAGGQPINSPDANQGEVQDGEGQPIAA